MSAACPYCLESRIEAGKRIYDWLNRPTAIPKTIAVYLQTYVRLCYRIDLASAHTFAGRLLEKILDSHETWGVMETEELDEDDPIEYPGNVLGLIAMIEKRAEKE